MAFLSCARGKKTNCREKVFVAEGSDPGESGPAGPEQTKQDAHQVPGQSRDNKALRRTFTRELASPRMSNGPQEGQDGETLGPEGACGRPRGRCPSPVPADPVVHRGPGLRFLPGISGSFSLCWDGVCSRMRALPRPAGRATERAHSCQHMHAAAGAQLCLASDDLPSQPVARLPGKVRGG